MPPSVSPDLKQNIIITFYLLFSHNYIAFAYLFGLLLCIGLALYKPSRFIMLSLLGFAVLLFSFEYDKHIVSGLREQTIRSFITETVHYRLQRVIEIVISQILPVFFYVLGWGFIFFSIVYASLKAGKKKKRE